MKVRSKSLFLRNHDNIVVSRLSSAFHNSPSLSRILWESFLNSEEGLGHHTTRTRSERKPLDKAVLLE